MNKSKVAIVKCTGYSGNAVYEAVKKGVDLLGGISSFVKENERILLKPNLLAARKKEEAVTTHPAVFEALVRLLSDQKVNLSYGDSPGLGAPLKAAKRAGIAEVAEKYGILLADFKKGSLVSFPNGKIQKDFNLAHGVQEADGIISLCKMKTHGYTNITGAVKNQLGCVYGLNKAHFHSKYPNVAHFCQMLVDLNMALPMRLYIMDGIIAMEGNGPGAGDPVKMNVLLFSTDPVALDSVYCRLVNLDPSFVPTITLGKESGLGTWLEEEIELAGDNMEELINPAFNVDRTRVSGKAVLALVRPFKSFMIRRPVIDGKKCTRCGICIDACPLPPCSKAVFFPKGNKKKKPCYDYDKCIRCYCCQELCPQKAITIKMPLIGRIIKGILCG